MSGEKKKNLRTKKGTQGAPRGGPCRAAVPQRLTMPADPARTTAAGRAASGAATPQGPAPPDPAGRSPPPAPPRGPKERGRGGRPKLAVPAWRRSPGSTRSPSAQPATGGPPAEGGPAPRRGHRKLRGRTMREGLFVLPPAGGGAGEGSGGGGGAGPPLSRREGPGCASSYRGGAGLLSPPRGRP